MENTLTKLFTDYIENRNTETGIFFTKEDDEYFSVNVSELSSRIYSVLNFLRNSGVKENDKVAILSENRVEWVIVDFACMFLKLISIPIYTSSSPEQMKYILQNSDTKICFVSNTLLLNKIMSIKNEVKSLIQVVIFNDADLTKYEKENVILFSTAVEMKNEIQIDAIFSYLKKLSSEIYCSDIVTIIYTSGTTGIPKGVMLTHNNIYSNITSCQKVLTINENDIFLSYLPYSHSYERTAGYYLAFFSGAKIYYAQNIDTIAKQLSEANPTIVITVPRLIDKIYNKLIKSGDDMKSGIRKKIFLWAIDYAMGSNIDKSRIKWKIADKLVYKKIRAKTGGNIRFFASGGGALNKSVGKFFDNIGIMILEGYGMTEASPVISVNPPQKNKYGTVGLPLYGVNVKLSHENEIIVSGDLVMKGYHEDDESTNDTIREGWLYTGDIGEIDSEGYIKITDRKKALIKTSGGKYVAPMQIEDLISTLTYVENVMIIGNERMYVTALIVPEKNELMEFAKKNNLTYTNFHDLISGTQVNKLIQKDIENIQKNLSSHERVRKFTLLEEPFSIESGELTPTMKIKRKFIEEKYKDIIESMYLKI